MNYEDAATWGRRITEYFGKEYTNEQALDIVNFLRSLTDADASKLYAKLKELNRSTYKIDVKALAESSNELGLRRYTDNRESNELMAGKRIPCSMCGKEFIFNRYSPCTDPTGGPVSSCPNCGWNEMQTLFWKEAGSPKPDENGYGANYAKWVKQYADGLDDRIRATLKNRLADEREARDKMRPVGKN